MNSDQFKQSELGESSVDPGKTARALLRERAIELAVSHGRTAQDVLKSDWEQAKRDLSVEPGAESKEPVHASMAAAEGWDPAPGSAGHKVPVPSGDDEDDEGRSDTERLVEEGVKEAERDQMRVAAQEAEKYE